MRIGICEDDPRDLARLQGFLEDARSGDSLSCFSDAAGLLLTIEGGATFDLLFLDVYLPDMKGTELAAAVREAHPAPQPSVAFITSSADHAIQAFSLSAVHYITKSCVLKDGREVLLSRAGAKDIRKAYQDYLFSRMVDRMDR